MPGYSIFFHDDDAVDRLLNQDWPEFPHLKEILPCVRRGAMKVDVWRVLAVYKYGGVYSDIDNWLTDKFNSTKMIAPHLSGFSFSDYNNRPSQWFFALEPKHPLAYFAMLAILTRVYKETNIAKPAVVFTTGPASFYDGFKRFIHFTPDVNMEINEVRDFVGIDLKVFRKIEKLNVTDGYVVGCYKCAEEVTLHGENRIVSRRKRIEIEGGVTHWPDAMKEEVKSGKFQLNGTCVDLLRKKQFEKEKLLVSRGENSMIAR